MLEYRSAPAPTISTASARAYLKVFWFSGLRKISELTTYRFRALVRAADDSART